MRCAWVSATRCCLRLGPAQSCATAGLHCRPKPRPAHAPHNPAAAPRPRCPARYADEYSPVRLEALARSKVSIERLEESDLDYATSVDSLARLRGRLKLAIANFQGCSGEYVDYVKKVGRWVRSSGCAGGWVGAQHEKVCGWVAANMATGDGGCLLLLGWGKLTGGWLPGLSCRCNVMPAALPMTLSLSAGLEHAGH